MEKDRAYVIQAAANAWRAKDVKEAKDLIDSPATARVVATVKLDVALERGKPTTRKPTSNLLSQAIVAELMRRLGVTREAFREVFYALAAEVLEEGQTTVGKALTQKNPDLLKVMAEIHDDVAEKLPPQTRAGSIYVQGLVKVSGQKVTYGE